MLLTEAPQLAFEWSLRLESAWPLPSIGPVSPGRTDLPAGACPPEQGAPRAAPPQLPALGTRTGHSQGGLSLRRVSGAGPGRHRLGDARSDGPSRVCLRVRPGWAKGGPGRAVPISPRRCARPPRALTFQRYGTDCFQAARRTRQSRRLSEWRRGPPNAEGRSGAVGPFPCFTLTVRADTVKYRTSFNDLSLHGAMRRGGRRACKRPTVGNRQARLMWSLWCVQGGSGVRGSRFGGHQGISPCRPLL